MKKLLLAAFLLSAGIITSQTVSAQDLKLPLGAKEIPTAPKAILDAFASAELQAEASGVIEVGTPTWYIFKGQFYTTFPVYYNGLIYIAIVEASKKGDVNDWGILSVSQNN